MIFQKIYQLQGELGRIYQKSNEDSYIRKSDKNIKTHYGST